MRAVIIGSGEIKDYSCIKSRIRDDDFIICADGGYDHALKMGLDTDVVIGDLDSIRSSVQAGEKIVYPKKKDHTDGELCVMYAAEKGFDDIVLIGMTGDRLDHTITDILLLDKCRNGVLIDDNNEIYLVRGRKEIYGRKGQTVSIIPINGDAHGVTAAGLEYPLNDETMYFASSRGVSNVMLGDKCVIDIKSGSALVIKVENV